MVNATTATEQQRGADDKNDLTRSGLFIVPTCFSLVIYVLPARLVIIHPSIGDQVILNKLVLFLMVFFMEKINFHYKYRTVLSVK